MVHRNKSSMDYVSLGCCALAFVLYLNTLNAGFVYDDRRAILGNPDVLSSTPLFQLLFNDFWGTPLIDSGSHGSYRPLCVLSFKLNHMVGGFKPMGYHLVNVLLHCLATGLVVKLARNILPYGYGTLISGLLFASHPIHTEAVAGIVGRADLIACNLYLLTLLSYIKHVQWREKCDLKHWLALFAAIVFASAAILCKETAITALAVCIIYDIIRGLNSYTRDKLRLRSIGVLCIALSTTLHLRLSIPGPTTQFSTADNPVAKANSLLTRFFTFTYLPVFNFKLLVYPETLSFDWGMDAIPRITSLFECRNFISLTFYLSLGQIIIKNINFLRKTIPKLMNSKRIGRSINKKKYHNQPNQKQRQQDDYHQQEHDNYCIVCKQQMIRHSSACRALNNNNNNNNNNSQTSVIACGCPQKINKFISLSPLKQYISTNSTYLNNNNSYNNNTSVANANANSNQHISEFLKDNNNNYSVIINNNTTNNNNNNNNNSYLNHNLYPITKNGVKNKLLSISVAKCEKTENSLNSASAILISITILTLPFLPAANIFFYVGFVVAERILYLPSVGYCLLIGLSLGKFINFNTNCKPIKSKLQNKSYKCERINNFNVKSIVTILLLIILISVYSVKTIQRNMDWRDEESLYRSAVSVNAPKALGNLGSVLSSQGRYEEAKLALLEALKHRPNMADVHYNLGVLYQNQQNYEKAVECFQKAIHFRPSLALAYLNLGTSLISLGRCNEAASILRDATKLDGTGLRDRMAHENARISSLLQLGGLYADQGKLQRALAVYREALHTLPKNYPPQGIYHRLGDVFAKLQQWNEAERFQRATLEVQPDHIAAHISYGTMLARNSSRSSEAEQYFKRAIRLAPLDPSVHHHYAEFLQSLSRHEEACDSRVRAAELAPDDYSLVVTAATALRMLDRKVEAEKWYRQAVTLKPDDARAHTNLGAILHLLGRTHQAAVSYKNALKLQPGDPTTLGNLEKLGIAEIS